MAWIFPAIVNPANKNKRRLEHSDQERNALFPAHRNTDDQHEQKDDQPHGRQDIQACGDNSKDARQLVVGLGAFVGFLGLRNFGSGFPSSRRRVVALEVAVGQQAIVDFFAGAKRRERGGARGGKRRAGGLAGPRHDPPGAIGWEPVFRP